MCFSTKNSQKMIKRGVFCWKCFVLMVILARNVGNVLFSLVILARNDEMYCFGSIVLRISPEKVIFSKESVYFWNKNMFIDYHEGSVGSFVAALNRFGLFLSRLGKREFQNSPDNDVVLVRGRPFFSCQVNREKKAEIQQVEDVE